MERIIAGLLLILAALCLYPAVGVISGPVLEKLYGVDIRDPNLLILMRHRAVLYGSIGLFLGFSAFRPVLHPVALITAVLVLGSFVLICVQVGDYNALLRKLVRVDSAAAGVALAAAVLLLWRRGLT